MEAVQEPCHAVASCGPADEDRPHEEPTCSGLAPPLLMHPDLDAANVLECELPVDVIEEVDFKIYRPLRKILEEKIFNGLDNFSFGGKLDIEIEPHSSSRPPPPRSDPLAPRDDELGTATHPRDPPAHPPGSSPKPKIEPNSSPRPSGRSIGSPGSSSPSPAAPPATSRYDVLNSDLHSTSTPLRFHTVHPGENWRSDIRWVSIDDTPTKAFFESIFHKLNLAAVVQPHIGDPKTEKLVLYSAFFVVRQHVYDSYFHEDFKKTGRNAWTFMTPLASMGVLDRYWERGEELSKVEREKAEAFAAAHGRVFGKFEEGRMRNVLLEEGDNAGEAERAGGEGNIGEAKRARGHGGASDSSSSCRREAGQSRQDEDESCSDEPSPSSCSRRTASTCSSTEPEMNNEPATSSPASPACHLTFKTQSSEQIRTYRYRRFKGICFADGFDHATQAGSCEAPLGFLCFTFGTDQMRHWENIGPFAGAQGRIHWRPDGSVDLTSNVVGGGSSGTKYGGRKSAPVGVDSWRERREKLAKDCLSGCSSTVRLRGGRDPGAEGEEGGRLVVDQLQRAKNAGDQNAGAKMLGQLVNALTKGTKMLGQLNAFRRTLWWGDDPAWAQEWEEWRGLVLALLLLRVGVVGAVKKISDFPGVVAADLEKFIEGSDDPIAARVEEWLRVCGVRISVADRDQSGKGANVVPTLTATGKRGSGAVCLGSSAQPQPFDAVAAALKALDFVVLVGEDGKSEMSDDIRISDFHLLWRCAAWSEEREKRLRQLLCDWQGASMVSVGARAASVECAGQHIMRRGENISVPVSVSSAVVDNFFALQREAVAFLQAKAEFEGGKSKFGKELLGPLTTIVLAASDAQVKKAVAPLAAIVLAASDAQVKKAVAPLAAIVLAASDAHVKNGSQVKKKVPASLPLSVEASSRLLRPFLRTPAQQALPLRRCDLDTLAALALATALVDGEDWPREFLTIADGREPDSTTTTTNLYDLALPPSANYAVPKMRTTSTSTTVDHDHDHYSLRCSPSTPTPQKRLVANALESEISSVCAGREYKPGEMIELNPVLMLDVSEGSVNKVGDEFHAAGFALGNGSLGMVLGLGAHMRRSCSRGNVDVLFVGRFAVFRARRVVCVGEELVVRAGSVTFEAFEGAELVRAAFGASSERTEDESRPTRISAEELEAIIHLPFRAVVAAEEEQHGGPQRADHDSLAVSPPLSEHPADHFHSPASVLFERTPNHILTTTPNHIRKSLVHPLAGFGLFASRPYCKGELVELNLCLQFEADPSRCDPKELQRYCFVSTTADWGNPDYCDDLLFGTDFPLCNMMIGLGSISNHGGKGKANVECYAVHQVGKWCLFLATRDIQEGEEILTDYGDVPAC